MTHAILAYDATDGGAVERRMAARQAHIDYMDEHIANGNMVIGAAILDDNEKMIGSIIMTKFKTRAEVDQWLEKEPYVAQNVWGDITVLPCKVGPSFEK